MKALREVEIDYTNYKGERRKRVVIPIEIRFASGLTYHPEPQWFLDATDIEKRARRTFAVKDIHAWRPL